MAWWTFWETERSVIMAGNVTLHPVEDGGIQFTCGNCGHPQQIEIPEVPPPFRGELSCPRCRQNRLVNVIGARDVGADLPASRRLWTATDAGRDSDRIERWKEGEVRPINDSFGRAIGMQTCISITPDPEDREHEILVMQVIFTNPEDDLGFPKVAAVRRLRPSYSDATRECGD